MAWPIETPKHHHKHHHVPARTWPTPPAGIIQGLLAWLGLW